MKKTKQIIGIILIVVAVAALVFWETEGRDRVMTFKVLVASEDIMEGELITRQMLGVVSSMPETLIEGAFAPDDISKIEGKEAAAPISRNQQISEALLRAPNEKSVDKRSPFLIKNEWIDSRSSSLRRGDTVEIYSRDGNHFIGDFEVVFVKDAGDKEITDDAPSDIRERTNGSGIIDHLEILTDMEEYQKLVLFLDSTGEKLLIVQKEGM